MMSDAEKYNEIVEILGVQHEQENIVILDEWIAQVGLDGVYHKALHIKERCAS